MGFAGIVHPSLKVRRAEDQQPTSFFRYSRIVSLHSRIHSIPKLPVDEKRFILLIPFMPHEVSTPTLTGLPIVPAVTVQCSLPRGRDEIFPTVYASRDALGLLRKIQ